METLIVHPDVTVFVLVTGTAITRRWCGGCGNSASARSASGRRRPPRRLASVCSEYKFWRTLVAEVDPAARPAVAAAFDIAAAEQLLVRAFEETARTTLTAAALKGKMAALDSSFDERNYGCRSFRTFWTASPAASGGPGTPAPTSPSNSSGSTTPLRGSSQGA